jgi:hypothetical protein
MKGTSPTCRGRFPFKPLFGDLQLQSHERDRAILPSP